MFKFNKTEDEDTDLEKLITRHIASMDNMSVETEDYTASATSLKLLMETRKIEEEIEKPWRPSADQVVAAGATLGSIAIIVLFEMRGVFTSKALSFVPKAR